jgi:hypothetical protein
MRKLPIIALVLAAMLAVTPRAHAADSAFRAIDVMSSTVMQEGQSSFAGLAARARVHPSRLINELELLPGIEYWRNSSTVSPYDIHTQRKDATLSIAMRYNFEWKTMHPYAGLGYGIHFLSSKVDAPAFGLNNATDSVTKGGLSGLGGMTFTLTPNLDNFIELEYHHIPDYRQLKINWGLGFHL